MGREQKKKINFLILLLSFVLLTTCSKHNERKVTILCHNEQFGIDKQKMLSQPICIFKAKKISLGSTILNVSNKYNKRGSDDTLVWAHNNSDNNIYETCNGDRNYYRLCNIDKKNIYIYESFMFADSLLYLYKAEMQMPNSLPMEKVKENILKYFPCITFEKNVSQTRKIFNGLVVETLYIEQNKEHNTTDFIIEYSYNNEKIKY
jgi:hypothetical protein